MSEVRWWWGCGVGVGLGVGWGWGVGGGLGGDGGGVGMVWWRWGAKETGGASTHFAIEERYLPYFQNNYFNLGLDNLFKYL